MREIHFEKIQGIDSISEKLAKVKLTDDKAVLLDGNIFVFDNEIDKNDEHKIVGVVNRINSSKIKISKIDVRNMYLNYHVGTLSDRYKTPIVMFVDQFYEFFIFAIDTESILTKHFNSIIKNLSKSKGEFYSGDEIIKDIVLV